MTLTRFVLIALATLALAALPTSGAWAQTPTNSYTVTQLGSLGGGNSTAYGVNDGSSSGPQVVGSSYTAAGLQHAFLWRDGSMTDLGTLGGSDSSGRGINNSGQVVGWANTAAGATRAFLWDPVTGMRDLGTLGGASSAAAGINDGGQVVGWADLANGQTDAFVWQNGRMYDLGTLSGGSGSSAAGINASGRVAGTAWDAVGNRRAFRWTPAVPNGTAGTMVALALVQSMAYGINAAGDVVGRSDGTLYLEPSTPYLWDSTGAHALPLLDTREDWYSGWSVYGGSAVVINDSRHVAGSALHVFGGGEVYGNDYSSSGVVWDSVNGTRSLGTFHGTRLSSSLTDREFGEARAINASGQIVADAYLLTPSPIPVRPQPWVSGVGDARVDLSWGASPGADSYNVKRADTWGGSYTPIATGVPGTTYTDTAVVNGNTYYYVVSAVNAWGESPDSDPVSARPVPPPAAPTGLTAIAGVEQVTLSWNPSAWADYYEIWHSNTPGGPYDWLAYTFGTSYVDPWLVGGTTYYYVVTAVNNAGASGISNEASATPTPPPPPPAPAGLTASPGDTRVTLSWNLSPGADYYNVKRSTSSGGPYTTVISMVGSSYVDTGLTNGVRYFYVVSAVNRGGESPNSNEASATPTGPPPPAPPTSLAANTAGRSVKLTWTQSASPGITQNRIYRATTSGGPYSVRATIAAGTTFMDGSLTSGVTYYYVVTAVDNRGKESAYSNQASAKAR
jgi:probable HAF family extracellular repeat protein